MEGASRRIAELTGAEWGIVTCGSAAALTLATTACVAGNDPVKMLRLPFTDGWVNRVIMLKNQRFAYDQAIRMVGTHIVEIETIADLDAALDEPVAMIAVLGTYEDAFQVRLEDIVAAPKPRGIPVLVDAASEHIEKPSPYLARGADMVIYSGGKFLRGPQTSGLLLGRKDLIQAAWCNASPHQAFARGMKVSKEDVIGVLAALEDVVRALATPPSEAARWNADLAAVAGRVTSLGGVRTEDVRRRRGARAAADRALGRGEVRLGRRGLRLRVLERRAARDAGRHGDHGELGRGRSVRPAAGRGRSGRRALAAALSAPAVAKPAPVVPKIDLRRRGMSMCPSCTASGSHRLTLQQQGAAISGSQSSQQFDGPVDGKPGCRRHPSDLPHPV